VVSGEWGVCECLVSGVDVGVGWAAAGAQGRCCVSTNGCRSARVDTPPQGPGGRRGEKGYVRDHQGRGVTGEGLKEKCVWACVLV
jgi:hypothetical protein